MSDIFISYASEDREHAERIASFFSTRGWAVWWDQEILPGETYNSKIAPAVSAAKCVVVLWSVRSVAKTYVQNEARRGMRRNALVPVLLETVAEVPMEFEHLSEARLSDWNGNDRHSEFERLLAAVSKLVDPAGQSTRASSRSRESKPDSRGEHAPSSSKPRSSPASPASDSNSSSSEVDLDDLDGYGWVPLPGGTFEMGTSDESNAQVHRVTVSPFRIARFPVTNAQYRVYVRDTKVSAPPHWPDADVPKGKELHPVVGVSWNSANAYAAWLSGRVRGRFGGRVELPTEAQWEYAARGTAGRQYPWGEPKPTKRLANFNGNVGDTTPVDRYPDGATPEGVHGLAGNVWEWCRDWYGGYEGAPVTYSAGAPKGTSRVLRGGSFNNSAGYRRGAYRGTPHPERGYVDVGFRVVWSVAGGQT